MVQAQLWSANCLLRPYARALPRAADAAVMQECIENPSLPSLAPEGRICASGNLFAHSHELSHPSLPSHARLGQLELDQTRSVPFMLSFGTA